MRLSITNDWADASIYHNLSAGGRRSYSVLETELVAQIEFTERTADNHLRHSKFVWLRDDKDAREVCRRARASYDSEASPKLGVGQ
jgi:ATP-dependent DNA ligase